MLTWRKNRAYILFHGLKRMDTRVDNNSNAKKNMLNMY
jgi:hypothetical protein